MKVRIEDHVKFDEARMAKIALATTGRCQLDLYCVAPGQSQRPHAHGDQDKIYVVLEGSGRFSLGGREERLGIQTSGEDRERLFFLSAGERTPDNRNIPIVRRW